MDESLRLRLAELGRLSSEGRFGEEIQEASQRYKALPPDVNLFLTFVDDYYHQQRSEEDAHLAEIADLFSRLIIVIYRDAKKQDEDVANALAFSFLKDYPHVPNTSLFSKWDDLAKAALGLKAASQTNFVLAWEQSKNLFRAYNEFLSGLLGFLLMAWGSVQGKTYSSNILISAYGVKLKEFTQLTGGEDGAFYLVGRIARPEIRNAIAHGTIWVDTATDTVKFIDKGREQSLPLTDFLGLGAVGSHIAQAYILAIATIMVLEYGDNSHISRLPMHSHQLYTFNS